MEDNLKPIPNGCTKAQFFTMFHPTPVKDLRDEINEIIYDYRKNLPKYSGLERHEIIVTNHIKKPELLIFIERNWWPNGYQKIGV